MKTATAFQYDGFTRKDFSLGKHQKGMWLPAHSFIFPIEQQYYTAERKNYGGKEL